MISSVCRVSSATLALLTVASACLAAETGYAPRRGALGGLIGGSWVLADADYSKERDAAGAFGGLDSRPRFAFAGNFRYVVNNRWRWQVSPGFLWAGYKHESPLPFSDPNFPADKTKEKVLTLVLPVSAQVQVTQRRGPWVYHLGAGPGVYRVWVENRRKVLKDPVSKRLHQGFYPGASAQLGAERFLTSLPSTAVEFSVAGHLVWTERAGRDRKLPSILSFGVPDDRNQFPSGFNSDLFAVEARVGANYYFDLSRFQKPRRPGVPPAGR